MPKEKKPFQNTTKSTGIYQENIDLTNHPNADNKTESQPLLPHERDESTGPASTQKPGDRRSREKIKKAHDDTQRGLIDTDRRGIPSDIVDSDIPAADDLSNVPDSEKDEKR